MGDVGWDVGGRLYLACARGLGAPPPFILHIIFLLNYGSDFSETNPI